MELLVVFQNNYQTLYETKKGLIIILEDHQQLHLQYHIHQFHDEF